MPSYTKRKGPIREAKTRKCVHLIESAVMMSLDRWSFLFFGISYRKNIYFTHITIFQSISSFDLYGICVLEYLDSNIVRLIKISQRARNRIWIRVFGFVSNILINNIFWLRIRSFQLNCPLYIGNSWRSFRLCYFTIFAIFLIVFFLVTTKNSVFYSRRRCSLHSLYPIIKTAICTIDLEIIGS